MSPYTVSVTGLARQPGAGKDLRLEIPAPDDMRTDVMGVPEGSPIRLEVRVEAVSDGIYVSGDITARVEGECVRCLDPVSRDQTFDVSELFLFPEAVERAVEDGDEEATEMWTTDGDTVDLEPLVRDTILSEMPFQPLCREDCHGLCPGCGIRLEDAEPGHEHVDIDPRLAALKDLLDGAPAEDSGADAGESPR